VRLSKNGRTRRIPVNSLARGAVLDVAPRRQRPGDPGECVSNAAYRTTARVFERAVEAAHATLAAAGKDTNRLDGYTVALQPPYVGVAARDGRTGSADAWVCGRSKS